MDQRVQFIAAIKQDELCNFSRLCGQFGISRSKGYKWLERYNLEGASGLENRLPNAIRHPNETPTEVIARILEVRKEHPFDGPKKLRARLLMANEPTPAASTIGDILQKHGLVRPRKSRLRVPPNPDPLTVAEAPNDVWCIDFKGNFKLGNGDTCYPLTLTDNFSRYILRCEALSEPTESNTRHVCELLFNELGLPKKIRSDNGTPFASTSLGGLSALSIWWLRLGIIPERIEPGEPQQNGRHERMHRTLKEQCPPEKDRPTQQVIFDRFVGDFNTHRPHEALNQTPPGKHYRPSQRVMPARIGNFEYPSEMQTRRVTNGHLSHRGSRVFLSKLLAGLDVGLRLLAEDDWDVFLGPMLLGRLQYRGKELKLTPNGTR